MRQRCNLQGWSGGMLPQKFWKNLKLESPVFEWPNFITAATDFLFDLISVKIFLFLATEYHLGLLNAKLAKYRSQLLEPSKSAGQKGTDNIINFCSFHILCQFSQKA